MNASSRPTRVVQLLILAGLLSGCSRDAAPGSGQAKSESGRFVAGLRPEDGPPRIGSTQDWILELRHSDGRPVNPARIAVDGGMPDHGHGLPTQPRITAYLGDGLYRMEGLKLSMAGRWVLVFDVRTPEGVDRVRLELEVQW